MAALGAKFSLRVKKLRQVMPSGGKKCNIFNIWVEMIFLHDVKISCSQSRLNIDDLSVYLYRSLWLNYLVVPWKKFLVIKKFQILIETFE